MAKEQVSVTLPAELREFVARAAGREDRSVAGQIRHLVGPSTGTRALRRRGGFFIRRPRELYLTAYSPDHSAE
jgi:CopG-like RHH_1 or ribbon-helix-helix domain, RHH_5